MWNCRCARGGSGRGGSWCPEQFHTSQEQHEQHVLLPSPGSSSQAVPAETWAVAPIFSSGVAAQLRLARAAVVSALAAGSPPGRRCAVCAPRSAAVPAVHSKFLNCAETSHTLIQVSRVHVSFGFRLLCKAIWKWE